MLELTETILEAWGEEAVLLIQDNIRTLPATKYGAMNASGRTAASVRYEVTRTGLFLYGIGYIFALETGRGPSKQAGSGGETLLMRIRKWIDEKPITPTDISKDSLAYLITRKIHQEGTLLHKMGGKSGILSNVINKQRIDKLKAQFLNELNTVVRSTLLEQTAQYNQATV